MYYLITLAVIAVLIVYIFNQLIRQRSLKDEAWSGIDVQLKRRHDLIPNIVEAVKGYKSYEQKTLADITQLRSQLMCPVPMKDKGKLENELSTALKSIFALAEAYPDLKANQNFLKLQETLTDIEDQIQLARRYYNGTVRNYNIAVQTFPNNFIAQLFLFKPAEFFELEYVTERKVPDVKFV